MTCNDCIHYSLCERFIPVDVGCEEFKDKNKIIELPCKVGDTVYINSWCGKAEPHKVRKITKPFLYTNLVTNEGISKEDRMDFYVDEFGKSVFLSKADAENKLKGGKI